MDIRSDRSVFPADPDERRRLVEPIRELFRGPRLDGVASVYLFGSQARGTAHRESDVDLGVLLDRRRFPGRIDRSVARVSLLSEAIAALGRNAIDLVVLNDVPARFGRAVVLEGERVLCLDEEADRIYRRDIQLLAADLDVFMRRMEPFKLEALRR